MKETSPNKVPQKGRGEGKRIGSLQTVAMHADMTGHMDAQAPHHQPFPPPLALPVPSASRPQLLHPHLKLHHAITVRRVQSERSLMPTLLHSRHNLSAIRLPNTSSNSCNDYTSQAALPAGPASYACLALPTTGAQIASQTIHHIRSQRIGVTEYSRHLPARCFLTSPSLPVASELRVLRSTPTTQVSQALLPSSLSNGGPDCHVFSVSQSTRCEEERRFSMWAQLGAIVLHPYPSPLNFA